MTEQMTYMVLFLMPVGWFSLYSICATEQLKGCLLNRTLYLKMTPWIGIIIRHYSWHFTDKTIHYFIRKTNSCLICN